MRALIVSDIHSNLEAFRAVLDDAGTFDALWCLGDIVGYGPEPNGCIDLLRSYEHVAIPGNHDWGVLGKLDLADFNVDARQANLWTRDRLSPEGRSYLEGLPEKVELEGVTLAHGSPRYPIWEYLLYASTAALNLAHYGTAVCMVGHTHVPVLFSTTADESEVEAYNLDERRPLALIEGRHIINPGSVGQPRDGDPRASYMLVDTAARTYELRRVAYPIERTQERMRELGLPERLVTRLELGW